jgi:hypothetical protein
LHFLTSPMQVVTYVLHFHFNLNFISSLVPSNLLIIVGCQILHLLKFNLKFFFNKIFVLSLILNQMQSLPCLASFMMIEHYDFRKCHIISLCRDVFQLFSWIGNFSNHFTIHPSLSNGTNNKWTSLTSLILALTKKNENLEHTH